MSAGSSYGNGQIKFIEKSFCSNGVCNDVTVCQTVDYNGEAKYYVPLRDVEGNRKSKELVINEMHHVNKKTGLDGHARIIILKSNVNSHVQKRLFGRRKQNLF